MNVHAAHAALVRAGPGGGVLLFGPPGFAWRSGLAIDWLIDDASRVIVRRHFMHSAQGLFVPMRDNDDDDDDNAAAAAAATVACLLHVLRLAYLGMPWLLPMPLTASLYLMK
jgi:hypothetical protein